MKGEVRPLKTQIHEGAYAPSLCFLGQIMRKKIYYNPEIRLSGEYYERALAHLENEVSYLREQRHLSKEADRLYCQALKALEVFKTTKRLGDAIFVAKLRG